MEKIKLGIIGCGNIGKVHTDNILGGKCPEIDLCAVCDLKEERRKEALEKKKKDAEKAFENAKTTPVQTK